MIGFDTSIKGISKENSMSRYLNPSEEPHVNVLVAFDAI